jgi:DNA-binding PadR family transcriptional regulator
MKILLKNHPVSVVLAGLRWRWGGMWNRCVEAVASDSILTVVEWGCVMRRDDDLARQILLEIEEMPDPIYEFGLLYGVPPEYRVRYYHLRLLADAGFLEESGQNGGMWRITNAGHDFLNLIRRPEAWERAKTAARGLSGFSLGILRDIALGYARQELARLGLPI